MRRINSSSSFQPGLLHIACLSIGQIKRAQYGTELQGCSDTVASEGHATILYVRRWALISLAASADRGELSKSGRLHNQSCGAGCSVDSPTGIPSDKLGTTGSQICRALWPMERISC